MPSTRTQRAVAILAALTISASVGACGSGDDDNGGSSGSSTSAQEPLSKDAYLKQVNAAQTKFATNAAKLNLADPSSAKDFGNSLGELKGLIDTLRKQLDDIVPPDAVTTEQDELVKQLTTYGAVIQQQKGALTSGNPQKAAAAAQRVGKASTDFSQDFDATIKQINDNLGLETSTAPSE
ncbi:MAG TPA: hypothetical protein VEW67_00575 [Thermoleophilaceae bacterium]|nr:hypothetical protein [Thermoleophilaceae bacterium]